MALLVRFCRVALVDGKCRKVEGKILDVGMPGEENFNDFF